MFLNGNKGNCSKQKDIDEIGSKFGFNNWLEFVVVILFLVVVVVIVVVDDADVVVVVVDDNVLDVDDNVLVVDVNVVAVVVSKVDIEDGMIVGGSGFVLGMMIVVFVVDSVSTSFFVVLNVLVEGCELVLSIAVDFSRLFNTSPIHVLKNPIFV